MSAKKTTATKIGTYPHTNVVLSIATAIFMMGAFGLLVMHTEKLSQLLRENIEVYIYLNRNLDKNEVEEIRKNLNEMNFVNEEFRFIDKEKAAQEMIEESGEDFVAFLGENPLRDAFMISLKQEFYDKDQLQIIKKRLESIKGVFEVDYQEDMIAQINSNVQKLGLVLLLLILILLITVVIMIHSAIRLALYSQRFLIRSMQLVGATDFFIKKPFLMRAFLQGLVGGLLACSGLLFMLTFFNLRIEELIILQDLSSLLFLIFSLVTTGILICVSSAYLALNRYLDMSVSELN